MNSQKKSIKALLLSSVVAATGANVATAQIEEVVVTAQKREESLNDVSISVAALGSDQLSKVGYTDPSDLALLVPGFSFAESGLNTPIYTLRGVGFSETSLAASSTVSVYVDEVPLPFPSTTKGAALDLQRVEVVKGPQGTLYGQNTTAGAINYISNKPTDEFEAGIETSIGRFSAINVGGYVSGPLSENVRARFAAKTEKADGWQVSQTRGNENAEVDKSSARLLIDVDVSEDVSLSFTLNGWTDDGETQSPQLVAFDLENPANENPALTSSPLAPSDPRATDFNPDFDLSKDDSFWQFGARVDWDINEDLSLTSITSYSEFETTAGNEFDGTAAEIFAFVTGGDIESFSQEVRLSGSSNKVDWVVGANFTDNSTRDTNLLAITGGTTSNYTGNGLGLGTGVNSAENFADQEIQTFGVFGSADWVINDKLSLTTGIRFTDFEADFTGCAGDTGDNTLSSIIQFVSNLIRGGQGLPLLPDEAFTPGVFATGTCTTFVDASDDPNLTATPGTIVDTLEEDNVSWRLALNYTPSEDMLVYGSLSKGYKAGSFPTIPSTSFLQYVPAVQEEVLAYEVGLKSTLVDNTLQFNAAAFYYDYKNKQLRGFFNDPVFATLSRLVNVPESEITGVEFDLIWLPVEGLTVIASGSLLDTEIKDFVSLNFSGDVTDFSGGVLSFAPESQLNLDVEYEWLVGQDMEAFAGANYAYRDESSATFGEDPRLNIDSYGVLGLRAGVSKDAWQISIYGENVTNEYYLNNVVPQFDTIKGFAGLPRTYGVRFKYDF